MHKRKLFIIIILVTHMLTGCSTTTSVKQVHPVVPGTVNIVGSDINEVFYGTWGIDDVLSGALSDNTKVLITKKFKLSSDQLIYPSDSSDNTILESPVYSISTIKEDDFLKIYNTSFSSLGIDKTTVMSITVSDKNKNIICTFFVKNGRTLVFYKNGIFFSLVKTV